MITPIFMLFSFEHFFDILEMKICQKNDFENIDFSLCDALITLFLNPKEQKNRNVDNVLQSMKKYIHNDIFDSYMTGAQNDSCEFFQQMMQAISKSTNTNIYEELFGMFFKITRTCQTCHMSTYRFEKYTNFHFSTINEEGTPLTSITEMMKYLLIDDAKQILICDNCNSLLDPKIIDLK